MSALIITQSLHNITQYLKVTCISNCNTNFADYSTTSAEKTQFLQVKTQLISADMLENKT